MNRTQTSPWLEPDPLRAMLSRRLTTYAALETPPTGELIEWLRDEARRRADAAVNEPDDHAYDRAVIRAEWLRRWAERLEDAMGLSDYPHAVDVLAVEDLATDRRMGRLDDRAVVAQAVRCRVNEMPVERVEAFGREETRHTHRIHFKRDPAVGVRHLIRWTPPGQAAAVTFTVKGTRRPRLSGLPWVVFAERHAAGDATT